MRKDEKNTCLSWTGDNPNPRLARGPSVCVICDVRECHAAAKPQSTIALQSCDVKFGESWRRQREKKTNKQKKTGRGGSFELQ